MVKKYVWSMEHKSILKFLYRKLILLGHIMR